MLDHIIKFRITLNLILAHAALHIDLDPTRILPNPAPRQVEDPRVLGVKRESWDRREEKTPGSEPEYLEAGCLLKEAIYSVSTSRY
jgi:hypothetical protein